MIKRYIPALVALFALIGAGAVYGYTQNGDPTPPWVKADGTVDSTKLPESFGVVDANGDVVKCSNGKELKVPAGLAVGPPTETPAQINARGNRPTASYVWRCGLGANPDQNPRRVPTE